MIDEFDLFAEDLLVEKSERIMVIVSASKVDYLLFAILEKFFLSRISGKKDDLLEGDQPLNTFSSRIKITYKLGIIDRQLYDLLEQLRAIRNKSAHNVAFEIHKSPFKDHISNMKKQLILRKSYHLTKKRYFENILDTSSKELQCLLLTLCVILQAVHGKTVVTLGIEETRKISTN